MFKLAVMQIVAFGSDDIANIFAKLAPKALDEMPFGVVQVDAAGKILIYNTVEGQIARYDASAAIGKNFFTDVAPCTEATGFRKKFDEGVKSGNLNVLFEWHTGTERMPVVQVHLKKAVCGTKFWIFIKVL